MPADTRSRLDHIAIFGKRDLSSVAQRLSSCRQGHWSIWPIRLPREVLQVATSELHAAKLLQYVSLLPKGSGTQELHASLANLPCLFLSLQGRPCFSKVYKTYSDCAGSLRASQPIPSSTCGELQPLVGCTRRLSFETCFSALFEQWCLCVTTTCVGLFITIGPMHSLTCLDSATLYLHHSSLYFVPIAAFKALQLSLFLLMLGT